MRLRNSEHTGWRCMYCHKPLAENEECMEYACKKGREAAERRMSEFVGTEDRARRQFPDESFDENRSRMGGFGRDGE